MIVSQIPVIMESVMTRLVTMNVNVSQDMKGHIVTRYNIETDKNSSIINFPFKEQK